MAIVSKPIASSRIQTSLSDGIPFQQNLCSEIVLSPTVQCGFTSPYSSVAENKECVYPFNLFQLEYVKRTRAILWATEAFGTGNVDFMRAGQHIFFKYESDLTMFIMKWVD